jgi:hypothetical protein
VARTLGSSVAAPAISAGAASVTPPVQAVRATRPGWRDTRLWIGLAIVAACIVAGVRILGAADHTVAVWGLKADAGAGAMLSRADLEVHRVHFDAADDLAGYFRADAGLPDQLALTRGVGAGDLLPRSAIGTAASTDTVQVPLAVDPAQVPPAVANGSVVDVYVVGADASRGAGDIGAPGGSSAAAAPALSAVTVVSAQRSEDVFGGSQTSRQLTLAVPEKRAQQFFALLGSLSDPTITVVLRPAG